MQVRGNNKGRQYKYKEMQTTKRQNDYKEMQYSSISIMIKKRWKTTTK